MAKLCSVLLISELYTLLFSRLMHFMHSVNIRECIPVNTPEQINLFYQELLDTFSCMTLDRALLLDYIQEPTFLINFNKTFFKISSDLNNVLESMTHTIKELNDSYSNMNQNSMFTHSLLIKKYKPIVKSDLKTCIATIQTQLNLLYLYTYNNIYKILDFPSELILPVCSFMVSLINIILDDRHPIYDILYLNYCAADITTLLFRLTDLLHNNKYFDMIIAENVLLLKELLCRISIDTDIKENLLIYCDNLEKNKTRIDLPEQFLDPLMLTEIKDPIMIPNNDSIFD